MLFIVLCHLYLDLCIACKFARCFFRGNGVVVVGGGDGGSGGGE